MTDEEQTMLGMADCMHMVRQELIEAGIIGKNVAPMFVAHAVQAHVFNVLAAEKRRAQILEATARHWKGNHDAQVDRARILMERPDMPLERVNAYKLVVSVAEDARRFQACRHVARTMPEEGGEDALVEGIDKYRVEHGL